MTTERRAALVVGVLFLITFATSIPALWLYQPVLDNPAGYITSAGSDGRIFFGAFLEMLLIVANVGTATVLFPILKRQSEMLSLSFVASRLVECTFIAIGIVCVLGVVSLGQDPSSGPSVGQDAAAAGGDAGAAGVALAAIKDWTFLLGPGFIVGIGNGLILGYLMYRSGLMPRALTWLGLVGGPVLILSGIAVLFDVFQQGGTGQAIATIPEFLWELAIGLYLTFVGFKPSPILREPAVARA
jgi:hypothetical protein